jgi:hypothetical protein
VIACGAYTLPLRQLCLHLDAHLLGLARPVQLLQSCSMVTVRIVQANPIVALG